MYTEQEREFSAVMQVVFEQVPDDPLARKGFFLAGFVVYISQHLL